MKIIGIDPGLRVTGWGFIEWEGSQVRYLGSGVIKTASHHSLAERLGVIFTSLTTLLESYQPDQAAVEKIFVNVNPQSSILLAQARAAAICAAVAKELPVHEYTALQLKKAVVGYGHAEKAQVQAMVQRLLCLNGLPSTDSADALAVALCHMHTQGSYLKNR